MKSLSWSATALLLVSAFDVIWQRIKLSNSANPTIIAGRFLNFEKSAYGKAMSTTSPTANEPMLCLPLACSSRLGC